MHGFAGSQIWNRLLDVAIALPCSLAVIVSQYVVPSYSRVEMYPMVVTALFSTGAGVIAARGAAMIAAAPS